jgi:hypothetical protein
MKVPVNRLRVIGIYEGISYLVLLFIAMPLKYFADLPKAVTYVGWAHGLLFVMFILAFVAALLPFGTFYLDKRLREEDYN